MTEPFVLDLASNPHPRMLHAAIRYRRAAKEGEPERTYWLGYLAAMADATGCTEDDLEAWMDSHET